ncbi:MAG: group I intron-associated PD-(D/E)XK endonuclease [Chloroflexota bacterium]
MIVRHQTKDKGDLGVAKTIPHLLEYGIRSCLPLSEHLPFDLIAVMPDFTTLRRVQVKYRKIARRGCIELNFRSNYYDSNGIYSKPVNMDEIDCYAIYSPETSEIYYLNINEIPQDMVAVTLRIEPTKNGQEKRVWWARDFVDPRRIASSQMIAQPYCRTVSEQDELAIAKASAYLMEQGIQPFIANSQYLPFDLIAVYPDMKTLKRIRIGWEYVYTTPYTDQYAFYDSTHKQCFVFGAADVPQGIEQITLADMNTKTCKFVG